MRFRLKNKSYVLNTKIKLVGKDGANLSIITSDINNPTSNYNLTANTITFCLSPLPAVIGDPEVIVNEYTTSGLDFENGLIDKIPTTIWNKSGTADITSTNKIFGDNSFETKALGDSLYTSSNIITGDAAPYSIEFYSLIKGSSKNASGYPEFTYPLISKNNNSPGGEQAFSIMNTMNPIIFRNSYFAPFSNVSGNYKINLNEINKHQITYDGSAIRWFINDKLELTAGTLKGFRADANTPFTFYRHSIPAYPAHDTNTHGIIDNINIHDGIATKVRDPDPYEEFLVVDLAFDGENNSTKIVDNARLNERNEIKYNDNVVALLHFDGNIDDEVSNVWNSNNSYYSINSSEILLNNTNLVLNGDSQIYNTSLPQLGNEYTIECFIKHPSSSSTSTKWEGIFSTKNNSGLYFNTYNDLTLYISTAKASAAISHDSVHHIALVAKNGNTNVFVDGILTLSSNSVLDATTSLYIGSGVNREYYTGRIDEFRITKGIARYTENFTPPTEPFNYVKHIKWTVNGNAKISTDQKFDGFSSLDCTVNGSYIEATSNFTFDLNDFTINTDVIFTNSIGTWDAICGNFDNSTTGTWSLWRAPDGRVVFSTHPNQFIVSLSALQPNTIYNIRVVRKDNQLYLYINKKLEALVPYLNVNINAEKAVRIGFNYVTNDIFNGYIKNFKIYKGVAIIPEDPTGKIQLDFDNNLNDNYNNSTWTNNGVTFNNVHSVKGSSIYTSGTQNIVCGANNNFNYGNSDFLIETDVKQMNKGSQFSAVLSNNNNYGTPVLTFGGTQSKFALYKDSGSSATHNIGNWEASDYTVIDNVYYNIKFMRKGSNLIFKKNDIVVGISNVALSGLINFNMNNYTAIGPAGSYNNAFNGYIDNFKSIKNYTDEVIIDKPAIHLPLETNAINTGFSNLTINSVGNPTYHVVDGRKCIKFEQGKYLTINSNNIFDLGTNSDFYLEFDYFPLQSNAVADNIQTILSNNNTWSSSFEANQRFAMYFNQSTKRIGFDLGARFSSGWLEVIGLYNWNKITLIRKGNEIIFCGSSFNVNENILLSLSQLFIGVSGWDANRYFVDGYMSNFKMFVGTSEIPETYNDKTVLDLDFKPTRKSYLFKDNNNKCVIHPVNIEYRDYLDSQYCCTFNGTNQYLQLGRNDLLNFGLDDFVFEIKFKIYAYGTTNSPVIINSGETSVTNGRFGISVELPSNLLCVFTTVSNTIQVLYSSNTVPLDTVNTVLITRNNGTLSINLNGTVTTGSFNHSVNMNLNSNTYIGSRMYGGSGTQSNKFNGSIYSLKIFRNTSDLSVLGNLVPEIPEIESDPYWNNVVAYLPLVNNYSDIKGNTWSVVGTPDITNHDNPISNNGSIRFHQWSNLRTTLPPVGTQDFTIEFWVKPMSAGDTYGRLFELGPRSATNLVFNNTVQNWPPQIMSQINNYYTNVFGNINLSANTWSFIVYQRVGYNYQLFINGIKVVDNYITAAYNLSGTSTFNLNSNQNNGERFDAYYTMLRVTHGVARYNDDFSPPTKVFPTY